LLRLRGAAARGRCRPAIVFRLSHVTADDNSQLCSWLIIDRKTPSQRSALTGCRLNDRIPLRNVLFVRNRAVKHYFEHSAQAQIVAGSVLL
jgi:hypothetical protein